MKIELCDRCGRVCDAIPLLLIADVKEGEDYFTFCGTKFHNRGIVLCSKCRADFYEWMNITDKFNQNLENGL